MINFIPVCLSGDLLMPAELNLTERQICDLEMLLMGAFYPVTGYMGKDDYLSVLNSMRLKNGDIWPIPIVLPVNKNLVGRNKSSENEFSFSQSIKLSDVLGTLIAELTVSEVYLPDIKLETEKVLGCADPNHPYYKIIQNSADCYYIGGAVTAIRKIIRYDNLDLRMSVDEVKTYIKKMGWKHVVGFQTRNPMHKCHFELTREALLRVETEEGDKARLLLTPVVGPTQQGDIDPHVRIRCYRKILKYYNSSDVKLVILPLSMRMAGPKEALWHALIRKNYGCTHMIVGRDHAGPTAKKLDGTPFYGEYDAHELIKSLEHEISIKPVLAKALVYVGDDNNGQYMEIDTLPKGYKSKTISGSDLRRLLRERKQIPSWYSFPEVSEELRRFFRPLCNMGFCVYFTGLPCSGKSALAMALEARLLQSENEDRQVTVLDADIIRTHLSKGLGFTKRDRQLNVKRIGFVASQIVKHRGICLVANIAPYAEDRKFNRDLISQSGGYVEVYVSTPQKICEQRDVKELYKKARDGIIKQFTGVSDPYEHPCDPELDINSSECLDEKVDTINQYLKTCGWIS